MIMIEFPARCALATPCISHKARQIGFPAITESRKHKKILGTYLKMKSYMQVIHGIFKETDKYH